LVVAGALPLNAPILAGKATAAERPPFSSPAFQEAQPAVARGWPTSPGTPVQPYDWVGWNGDFFGDCRGDCSLALFGGKHVATSMTRIFFVNYPPRPPQEWRWRNSYVGAAAFSRRLVIFWNALSVEPEFGIGQRFGELHAIEFWAALTFRWSYFPWNDYLRTSIGVSDGLSITTKIDPGERALNNYKIVGHRLVFTASNLLNFFTPEVTFALPQYPAYELMFRFPPSLGDLRAV